MEIWLLVIAVIVFILLEGFFSGSEMAFVNADKYKLALATDAGSRRALMALHLIKKPAYFFSTTLLGTNLSTVAGSVMITLFIIYRYGPEYAPLAIIYWPFALTFGEIVPKSIYQHHADRIVLHVAPALFFFSYLFFPVVWLLSKLTEVLLGGVKKSTMQLGHVTREELEIILKMGRDEESDVRHSERTMISRIFDLADSKVKDIMTPQADIIAIPVTTTRAEAEQQFEKHGFSRIPVYDGRIFNIVGIISGADLIFSADAATVKDLMRTAYFVSEEMPLDELFAAMKKRGDELAVAVDEYGAATGLVAVEDLLEEVVGEIRDEHDEEQLLYRRLGKHRFAMSGRLEIGSANEKLKLEIPDGDYNTIAGFVIHKLGRIPRPGEAFHSGRYEYVISRASERAVLEIEACRISKEHE
jgi:CBS domain containing-hemolysin-like protein